MTSYDHVIMRQSWEVRLSGKEDYQRLQASAKSVFEEKLNSILERIFSQYVPEDVVITIDQLKVDLGRLDLQELEREVVRKIQKNLPPVIKEQAHKAVLDPQKKYVTPLPNAKLKAIQHYLIHGYFAWWMPSNAQSTIQKIYLELLQALPESLQELWFQLSDTPNAIKRFITHFSPSTIRKTIQLLASAHQGSIFAIAQDLMRMHRAYHLSAGTPTSFEQAVWVATLSQTLLLQNNFNERGFIQKTFYKLAHELNTSYQAIVFTLAKYFEKNKKATQLCQSNLPSLVADLHEDLATPNPYNPPKASLPRLIKRFDDLLLLDRKEDTHELPLLLEKILMQANQEEVRGLLHGWSQQKEQLHKLANALRGHHIVQLIALLQPTIKDAFLLTKDLWTNDVPQGRADEGKAAKLVAKTLQYISQRPADPTAAAYLAYIFKDLPKGFSLDKLAMSVSQNKAQLSQAYTQAAVEAMTKVLSAPSKHITASTNSLSVWEINLKNYLVQTVIPTGYASAYDFKQNIIASLQEEAKRKVFKQLLTEQAWLVRVLANFDANEREQLLSHLAAAHYPSLQVLQRAFIASMTSSEEVQPARQFQQFLLAYLGRATPEQVTVSQIVKYLSQQPTLTPSFFSKRFYELVAQQDAVLAQQMATIVLDHTQFSQEQGNSAVSFSKEPRNALFLSSADNNYPNSKLWPQLDALRKVFEEVLSVVKSTAKQRAKVEQALKDLLPTITQDPATLDSMHSYVASWVKQLTKQENNSIRKALIKRLEDELGTLINFRQLPEAPTPFFSALDVQNFLLEGVLPTGYNKPAEFITALIKAAQKTAFKTQILALLQNNLTETQIIQHVPEQYLQALGAVLAPLSPEMLTTYQQVLLKADVLPAATTAEKQNFLYILFLTSAPQAAAATRFIHLTLLKISQQANLSKKELLRRINLAAVQTAQPALIREELAYLAPTFSVEEPADELEITLSPTYHALSKGLIKATMLAQYYTNLLPAIKQLIQGGLSSSISRQQIVHIVEKAFPQLELSNKYAISNLVGQAVQQVGSKYVQEVEGSWKQFLHTGKLSGSYPTFSTLFKALLAATSQAKNLIYEHLQASYSRKRLVASSSNKELEQVVLLLNEPAAANIIKNIHEVYARWNHIGTTTVSQRDLRNTWWEAALASLITFTPTSFQEKTWLAHSLAVLSATLGIDQNFLLATLTNRAYPEPPGTQEKRHFNRLIRAIQQDWRRKVRKHAKELWPKQPVLRELHKLLTLGLPTFAEHKATAIARLEEQLQTPLDARDKALKKVLLIHPNKELAAQRLAYYFSGPIVQRFIQLLAGQSAPLIQQYLAVVNAREITQHLETIDPFTWQKCNEVVVLAYLLESGDTSFDGQAFINYYLEKLSKYTGATQAAIKQLLTEHVLPEASIVLNFLKQAQTTPLEQADKFTSVERSELEPSLLKNKVPKVQGTDHREIKIYIGNGGIVFLWPFLEQLFQDQGLMKKGKFIDEVSSKNAVHILQYLVTARLRTSEWKLILNKILCGMAYDYPIPSNYQTKGEVLPVEGSIEISPDIAQDTEEPTDEVLQQTEIEVQVENTTKLALEINQLKQYCTTWLESILNEWQSLKHLEKFEEYQKGFTLEDFKTYFLRRDSILRRIKGEEAYYWHLTIPMEAHDSKQIAPPWSINKVRLPWMQEELIIFWLPNFAREV